ncbi:MAG: hypothetical protein M3075_10550 [Candidatus Dormibacteraeota bacterium]|nr:hypothetical protein [Candidatus Dormibacteraeota bacterium]
MLAAVVVLVLLIPVLVALVYFAPVKRLVARILPLDPDDPVHTVALILAIVAVINFLLQDLQAATIPNLARLAYQSIRLGLIDVLFSELPIVMLGFLGVGFLVRRDARRSLDRLGLVKPALWQPALRLALSVILYLLADGLDRAEKALTPDIAQQLAQTNQSLLGHLTDPVSALLVGICAGVGEEVLFRGALQPRLGIAFTTILFA